MKVLAKKINVLMQIFYVGWTSVLVIIINSESNYSNLCQHGTQLV